MATSKAPPAHGTDTSAMDTFMTPMSVACPTEQPAKPLGRLLQNSGALPTSPLARSVSAGNVLSVPTPKSPKPATAWGAANRPTTSTGTSLHGTRAMRTTACGPDPAAPCRTITVRRRPSSASGTGRGSDCKENQGSTPMKTVRPVVRAKSPRMVDAANDATVPVEGLEPSPIKTATLATPTRKKKLKVVHDEKVTTTPQMSPIPTSAAKVKRTPRRSATKTPGGMVGWSPRSHPNWAHARCASPVATTDSAPTAFAVPTAATAMLESKEKAAAAPAKFTAHTPSKSSDSVGSGAGAGSAKSGRKMNLTPSTLAHIRATKVASTPESGLSPEPVTKEYIVLRSEDLTACENPQESLEIVLAAFECLDWAARYRAIETVRQLVLFSPEALHAHLERIVPAVTEAVLSIRSAFARNAILAVGDLYAGLGALLLPYLNATVVVLLRRAAHDKGFIADAANGALLQAVQGLPIAAMLYELVGHSKNRSSALAGRSAFFADKCVAAMPQAVVASIDLAPVIAAASDYLWGKNPDSRTAVKRMLRRITKSLGKPVMEAAVRAALPTADADTLIRRCLAEKAKKGGTSRSRLRDRIMARRRAEASTGEGAAEGK